MLMNNLSMAFYSYLYFSSEAVQRAQFFWLTATLNCADISKCAEAAKANAQYSGLHFLLLLLFFLPFFTSYPKMSTYLHDKVDMVWSLLKIKKI